MFLFIRWIYFCFVTFEQFFLPPFLLLHYINVFPLILYHGDIFLCIFLDRLKQGDSFAIICDIYQKPTAQPYSTLCYLSNFQSCPPFSSYSPASKKAKYSNFSSYYSCIHSIMVVFFCLYFLFKRLIHSTDASMAIRQAFV